MNYSCCRVGFRRRPVLGTLVLFRRVPLRSQLLCVRFLGSPGIVQRPRHRHRGDGFSECSTHIRGTPPLISFPDSPSLQVSNRPLILNVSFSSTQLFTTGPAPTTSPNSKVTLYPGWRGLSEPTALCRPYVPRTSLGPVVLGSNPILHRITTTSPSEFLRYTGDRAAEFAVGAVDTSSPSPP